MSIKITITDDHAITIGGIENIIRGVEDMEIISTYLSGTELLEGLKIRQPDVLLLDILMPDLSGQELTEMITETYPSIGILALTSLDAPYYVKGMMRRGCKGYLLKNTTQDNLLNGIREVARGNEFIEPALREYMLHNILKGKKSHFTGPIPMLTQREKEVLQLIVEEYTSQEIADKLFISLRTVNGHRFNLLQKLDAKNTVGLVKAALQMGMEV